MLSPTKFRDIVSGRQAGLLAASLRVLLRLAEFPYSWAMRLRNCWYDRALAESHSVDARVISIGNLTLGGTGKTPLVQWIGRRLQRQEVRFAIVSRGYRAAPAGVNDEALELQLALPDVPHHQDRDRVAAAREVIKQYRSQVILLDDGFQHRRLARDLDVVLLDATEPFGFDHVFPRGTLREPLAGLSRADVVVLSRADMLDKTARRQVRDRVARLAPDVLWCEIVHGPDELINTQGATSPTSTLAGKRVAAFSGIGNPAGFRHTLATLDCELIAWREYPDHHHYTSEDMESLAEWAVGADLVLCTRKDLVKLHHAALGRVPLWAVSVELRFLAGQELLESALDQLMAS